jgi:transcriptional regulator with XRE-family HTH domain
MLADLSGLSQGYISKIESGQKPLDRKSTQVAIASALNISVAQLLGQPTENGDPARQRVTVHIPAIRSALIELSAGERPKPTRDRDTLHRTVREITDVTKGADYAAAAPVLPALLLDVAGHGEAMTPEFVEALHATLDVLRQPVGATWR